MCISTSSGIISIISQPKNYETDVVDNEKSIVSEEQVGNASAEIETDTINDNTDSIVNDTAGINTDVTGDTCSTG